MIQIFHTCYGRAPSESAGRPAARVAVLRGGPDGHQESHADGARSSADLEPTSGFDLLNRLLAGKLRAVGGSIRADVRGNLRHQVTSASQPPPSRREPPDSPHSSHQSQFDRMTGGTAAVQGHMSSAD